MRIDPLAIAYSRALMELARDAGRLRPVLEDVRLLARTYADVPDFRTFIESPALNARVKGELLERVFRGKLDDLTLNFLELLIDKKRQVLLPEVFVLSEELYDREVGRMHVEVVTAVPLEPQVQVELMGILEGKLKKKVVLRKAVLPEVMGGMILRYGDLVADGSVRTALDKIRSGMERTDLGSELVHENQSR